MLSVVIVRRVSAAVCFSLLVDEVNCDSPQLHSLTSACVLSAGACLSRWWPTASTETSCVPQVRLCFYKLSGADLCVLLFFLFLFSILTLIQTDHSNMCGRNGLQVDMRFCLKHVLTCKQASRHTTWSPHAFVFFAKIIVCCMDFLVLKGAICKNWPPVKIKQIGGSISLAIS